MKQSLDRDRLDEIVDSMSENTTKIGNFKQYLRAVLFNAPSTIGNYYTSLVAHEMASGAFAPKKPPDSLTSEEYARLTLCAADEV